MERPAQPLALFPESFCGLAAHSHNGTWVKDASRRFEVEHRRRAIAAILRSKEGAWMDAA